MWKLQDKPNASVLCVCTFCPNANVEMKGFLGQQNLALNDRWEEEGTISSHFSSHLETTDTEHRCEDVHAAFCKKTT